jgi:thiol-disulfide isomerase/thioredoxin
VISPAHILLSAAALALALNAKADGVEAGQKAPNCALRAFEGGQPYDLQRFHGKVLYVDFWASWCGPCAQSFPFMNKLDQELRGRGLQIVGVNVDEQAEDALGFLAKRPALFTIGADVGGRCAQGFGVKAMPSTYLIDRKGVVRHVHLGFRPGEAEDLRGVVERLLAESPPDPRQQKPGMQQHRHEAN